MEKASATLNRHSRSAATFAPEASFLQRLYQRLSALYGEQAWWPAESAFEVAVGAVLTQNAAWTNVERAIVRMREADLLDEEAVLRCELGDLAEAIRPSGYFNVKARRLRNLAQFFDSQGGLAQFARQPLTRQRPALLAVDGIGPETADDILLYALDRPVFVIDAYTRRILQRHGMARGDEPYEEMRAGFERSLPADVSSYQQFHAVIVAHAKQLCRKRPLCTVCSLADACAEGIRQSR